MNGNNFIGKSLTMLLIPGLLPLFSQNIEESLWPELSPFDIVYKIDLRVHSAESEHPQAVLDEILTEVNTIWLTQAGVVFDVTFVDDDEIEQSGFDIWISAEKRSYNGVYQGQHNIWTTDNPSLGSAPDPADHNCARTTGHELGHGLSLGHYNGFDDSNNNLMSSGRRGWQLLEAQVSESRDRAESWNNLDATPINVDDITSTYGLVKNIPTQAQNVWNIRVSSATPDYSHINLPGEGGFRLNISNIKGKIIRSINTPRLTADNFQGLRPGVYQVRVLSE